MEWFYLYFYALGGLWFLSKFNWEIINHFENNYKHAVVYLEKHEKRYNHNTSSNEDEENSHILKNLTRAKEHKKFAYLSKNFFYILQVVIYGTSGIVASLLINEAMPTAKELLSNIISINISK